MRINHNFINYRPDIDGLRAIAVLLVVIHHAFPSSLPGGFIGVDLFFVISGYLISTIIFQNLQQGTFSFLDFYKRRVKRIFPALCLVLISSFVYGWFTLLPSDYKQLGKHMAAGAAFVSNFAFWSESGYFDGGSKLKPLLHLWSLGVEEQYYIFWPLIVLLVWKRKINLLAVCFVLFILSFVINIVIVRQDSIAAFYSPLSRFWELLTGSILAYTVLHPTNRAMSTFYCDNLAWAGVLLLIIGVYFTNPERRFPGFWALLPTIAAYLLIKAGPYAWFNRYILSNKLMVWVGLISFPLYLWHWPILVFLQIHENETPSVFLSWGAVASSLLLGWITYRFVEIPLRFTSRFKKSIAMLISVMLSIAIIGGYTFYRNGFDFRFPEIIRALTSAKIDLHEGWRLHTCILDISNTVSDFSDQCEDKQKRPLLFLWGDSHAAALYPGLKHLQEQGGYDFGIVQRNAAICPPILNYERADNVGRWCNAINNDNFSLMAKLRPDIVILYAYWANGINNDGSLGGLYELNKLESTITSLKSIGINEIIILGPTPYWNNTLPENILNFWKNSKSLIDPPVYLTYGLNPNLNMYNKTMQQLAIKNNVTYINSLSYLCNTNGCLSRDSINGSSVASIDYGHLTVSASESFIRSIASSIFTSK